MSSINPFSNPHRHERQSLHPFSAKKISVPRENILDLRAVLQAKEDAKTRKAEEVKTSQRWAKIFRTSSAGASVRSDRSA